MLARQQREPVEVLRGEAHRHLVPRRRAQEIEADLRRVDGAAGQHAVERPRLAERRHPEEADLALLLKLRERGHNLVQHVGDPDAPLAPDARDRIVQVEEVEPAPAEQREAVLDRPRERARHIRQVGRAQPALGAHDHRRSQRTQDHAQVLLRLAAAIGRRRVEVVDAEFDRPRDRPLPLDRRAPHHQPADIPAPEGQRGDLEPGPAQRPVFH